MNPDQLCTKCGQNTSGYKCDMCGAESEMHDDQHACGGQHCVAKCIGCSQAETNCTCPAVTTSTGGEPATPTA